MYRIGEGSIHNIRNAYSCDDGRRGSIIFSKGLGVPMNWELFCFSLKKDKIDGIFRHDISKK